MAFDALNMEAGSRCASANSESIDEWVVEKVLRQGVGGTCYLVRSRITDTRMVQKVIAPDFRVGYHEVSSMLTQVGLY